MKRIGWPLLVDFANQSRVLHTCLWLFEMGICGRIPSYDEVRE